MEVQTLHTGPSYKAPSARTAPPSGYGTLLDDWSERTFAAFKPAPLPRRS
ncbi:hypothetical protein [Sphingomonas montanisoli]|nr:hypothetical protein [Sphingomonas montanisoli]